MSEKKEYIERGALNEKAEIIRKKMLTEKHAPLTIDIMNGFADLLDRYAEDIPAADVEPVVRGEWFLLDDCSNAGVYCSVCTKAVFKESAWYKNVHLKSKYCPNCGAHMERSGSGE